MSMTIETVTIPIVRTPKSNGTVPVDLVEAMSVVAASRATRAIIKAYAAAGVTGNLIVPLVTDCPVDPATLGRAMRQVWKAALQGAENGDAVRVELRPNRGADVVDIIAGPATDVRTDKAS
ncbi:hypothetical protein NLM31_36750 [Bradyrhizobium sp. CCGUVB4N]|uniref:hypothetical protein n=1 Tax=Bradyrhizobium sp. CCGUVB4N TaxID=2949631 RepID=UPI0020B3BE6D|nr:hypothetical protein [Bradyrhizobium sp. CCGUVB4N]MCP3385952.1 hypothetical protein [Bradyrhizobium sp. CCGUVB4N]